MGSESLADILRTDGLEGYARYWILLEHLAGLFDGESTSFRIPKETVRGLFRIRSWTELDSFADRLTTVRGLDVKRNENVFEIEASILLELLDRDFKKARKERGADAPKIKTKNKIEDKELDKDNTTTAVAKIAPAAPAKFNAKSNDEVLSRIPQETKARWLELYNRDTDFIQRELIKAIGYYFENADKKPKSLKGWLRALSTWLERSWDWRAKNTKGEKSEAQTHEDMMNIIKGGYDVVS